MIPSWKRYLSYLSEMHIESAPSDINPHLYVSLQKGKLQLSTENAIYSYAENYHNFSGSFEHLDLTNIRKKEILVLGFGLGSIPIILENTFKIKAYYTGVEIDENVIYLFEKYAAADIQSPTQLYCADAFIFTSSCAQKFELVCSDIFLDNEIPEDYWSEAYLNNLANILSPTGLLILNTLALSEANKKRADAYFHQVYKKMFPEAVKLEVHNNYMLLSHKTWLK